MIRSIRSVLVTKINRVSGGAALAAAGLLVFAASGAGSRINTWSKLPWYVTTPAIHRMMLKPNTKYSRFEHLPIDTKLACTQLQEPEFLQSHELFDLCNRRDTTNDRPYP